MNDPFTLWFLKIGDLLFGWMLALPRDIGLLALAILTALALVVIRRYTTDQDRLSRVKEDLAVLKNRLKQAKKEKDKDAITNLRQLQTRVGFIRMKGEGRTLLWAMLPLAFLAGWAYERFPYLPPKSGETFEVRLVQSASATGQLAHLLPTPHLKPESPVARMEIAPDQNREAWATWSIRFDGKEPSNAVFVTPAGRFTHPIPPAGVLPLIRIDQKAPTLLSTQILLPERKLFGIIPGFPNWGLPAWVVGYLLIVIALVPLTKKIIRVN